MNLFIDQKYYRLFLSPVRVEQISQLALTRPDMMDCAALQTICSNLDESNRALFLEQLSCAGSAEAVEQWLAGHIPQVQAVIGEALERALFLVQTVSES